MRALLLLLVVLVPAVAGAETPAQRGKKLITDQIATLTKAKGKMEDFIDPDALVLGMGTYQLKDSSSDLYQGFAGGSPHSVIKKAQLKSIAAGGTDSAVWVTAEVTITTRGQEPGFKPMTSTETFRVSELVVADGDKWKVVAAIFDSPQSPSAHDGPVTALAGVTTPGALAKLASSVSSIEAALANDPGVFVVGTDKGERAIGPAAAKKLLKRWSKLTLEIDTTVREVTTKTWGFVQANVTMVKGKQRFPMKILLVAIPAADGAWTVGGVHYTSM